MPGISPPTALDFNALIKELRNQRKQEQRGFIEFSKITSHKLYNLLQSDPWNDKKLFDSKCLVIDNRPSNEFATSHLRGAMNITSPQELDVLLGPSTSSTLEQRYSVIVYGNHENIDTTELFKLIQKRVDRIQAIFLLKDKYTTLQIMYPCLCLASDEEHPDSVRQAEAWTNLPIEIIPNQLYLVHDNTRLIMTSIAPRLLKIDFILDVSTRPMISNESVIPSSESGQPAQYLSISPDPKLRVDPTSTAIIPSTIEKETLHYVVEELSRRIEISGTKSLIFSTDSPSVAAASIVAFLMKYHNWGINTALGCLMSKSINPVWLPNQLEALRTFHPNESSSSSSSHSQAK